MIVNKRKHDIHGNPVVTGLAAKVGRYILDQSEEPREMYEAAGQVLMGMCEASLFAVEKPENLERIRDAIMADLQELMDHVKTFQPPTKDEQKAKIASKLGWH